MIPVKIFSDDDVKNILDIGNTVKCVENAYILKANHQARLFPLISEDLFHGSADMDIKSGVLNGENVFGLKLVAWFGGNEKLGLPALTGLTMVFDLRNGFPIAIINARHLTAMRTGAAAAVGVKYLAKRDLKVLLVAGTGFQAAFQIAATVSEMPSIRKVIIFNPIRYESAVRFQQTINAELVKIRNDIQDLDNKSWRERIESIDFIAVEHPRKALEEADAVVTVTPSRKAFLSKGWIRPGTHFSCMGADMPGKQEIDEKIFDKALIFADDVMLASTVGETQTAVKTGIVNINRIMDIGHLIQGSSKGRTSNQDTTIFDSTGIALQDLAVSKYLIEKAEEMNIGTVVHI